MTGKPVPTARIIVDDARNALTELPRHIARTCVTSPPYWGLRDYDSSRQIGQEDTPFEYVENLVHLFRSVRDVLTKDGTLWLNVGDSYVGTGHKGEWKDPKNPKGRNGQAIALNNKVPGLKPKDMIGVPWLLAFALQKDGWYLRSDIIWHKPNAQPSPVKDRPVTSYEHIFLLSPSRTYYYDHDAVKEPRVDGKGTRSQRDVWSINTTPFSGAHFAVYPKELVLPCILAGSAEGDTVLDPFHGSGTTGIVALNHNRNYIGLEANLAFADISMERFRNEITTPYTLESS